METLVKMSNIKNKRKYEYSCLPPDQVMGMHVNIKEFLDLAKFGHREMMRIGITGHIGLNPAETDAIEQGIHAARQYSIWLMLLWIHVLLLKMLPYRLKIIPTRLVRCPQWLL
jgi:hypothetical protein